MPNVWETTPFFTGQGNRPLFAIKVEESLISEAESRLDFVLAAAFFAAMAIAFSICACNRLDSFCFCLRRARRLLSCPASFCFSLDFLCCSFPVLLQL